ncbi:MAG: hypothetical protein R2761_02460 [Acidimicrobiales bacterium]
MSSHDNCPPGLPSPTGRHPVGRRFYDLTDPDRADPYRRWTSARRKLPVAVWYPAEAGTGSPARYLPGTWRVLSTAWGLGASAISPHARDGAVPVDDERFPLVVFSASANPALCYSALLEDLASHGYVVAGVSHPYESIPITAYQHGWPALMRPRSLGGALRAPGRRPYEVDRDERAAVVSVKAGDLRFVADRIAGEAGPLGLPVDPGRRAAIGHSFGGAAAALVGRDPAWAAVVNLDGGLWLEPADVAVSTPVLQLFAEHPEYSQPPPDASRAGDERQDAYAAIDRVTTVGGWQALHEQAKPGVAAVVRGATHTSFCDWPLLPLHRWSPAQASLGGRSGPAVWRCVSSATRLFLDRWCCGAAVDVDATLGTDRRFFVAPPSSLFPAGGSSRDHDANVPFRR